MTDDVRELPPPVLLAALICDMVIVDALTGKGTVVGIFDVINAPKYPAQHPTLFVFCQLTNGRGRIGIRFHIIDLGDDEKIIQQGSLEQEFTDVREVVNVVLRLSGLVFPHPGEYRVQIFAGTDFLGERRIICKERAGPGGENDERL